MTTTNTTERAFAALEQCFKRLQPHSCGGFTADDILFQMRDAFGNIDEELDALWQAKRIKPCGFSDEDEDVTCWEVVR